MMYHNLVGLTGIALVTVLWMSNTADGCYPSQHWISCLIDTCKLGGKCPGDPDADCKMEKTKCNGCKPVWYTKTGEKANCAAKKNLKLCPGGENVVHCKVDSCKWPCSHPDFKGVACRQSYCGKCAAEYFISGKWVRCPVSSTGRKGDSEKLPIDTVVGDSCMKVPCSIDICINKKCPKVPRAVCRPDGCNTCKPAWFLDNRPVDCKTGELIKQKPLVSPAPPPWQRACAEGVSLTECDMKVCEKKICRNFPDAKCRPDGCAGCKDTWYVDNKLVDCLSTDCPPRVPIVKCVDDPCKYFGHYCPAAECRASQCGKCEAKFFANGQEIDCAMPPKECPAGVKPLNCPWYTCPSNICPSNMRLMCRINPCGNTCKYEFIDIYNGEPMPCRVFDGEGRSRTAQNENTGQTSGIDRPPLLGDIVAPDPSPFGLGLPQVQGVDNLSGSSENFVNDVNLRPVEVSQSIGNSGGFNVQSDLTNAGPPITDPDLLTLLRAFPHEVLNIPSAAIKTALKKGVSKISEQSVQNSVPVKNVRADRGRKRKVLIKPKPQNVPKSDINKPKGEQTMKPFFNVGSNVVDNQLLELAPKQSSAFPEVRRASMAQPSSSGSSIGPEARNFQPFKEKQKLTTITKTVAPSSLPVEMSRDINSVQLGRVVSKDSSRKDNSKNEISNMSSATILAAIEKGQPLNINSQDLGKLISDQNPRKDNSRKETPKKQNVNKSPQRNVGMGVPISMDMFAQWAMG